MSCLLMEQNTHLALCHWTRLGLFLVPFFLPLPASSCSQPGWQEPYSTLSGVFGRPPPSLAKCPILAKKAPWALSCSGGHTECLGQPSWRVSSAQSRELNSNARKGPKGQAGPSWLQPSSCG